MFLLLFLQRMGQGGVEQTQGVLLPEVSQLCPVCDGIWQHRVMNRSPGMLVQAAEKIFHTMQDLHMVLHMVLDNFGNNGVYCRCPASFELV